jgi:phosphoglycerol transferase
MLTNGSASPRRKLLRTSLVLLLEALFIVAVFAIVFQERFLRFDIPFVAEGDALWFSVIAKTLLDTGWVYHAPRLGAPFEFWPVAFPVATHFDWLLMKVLAVPFANVGGILNAFWISSTILTAWNSTAALRLLGIRFTVAVPTSLAYALLPFAFYRNISHLNLVYYSVPLVSLLIIYIALNGDLRRGRQVLFLGLAGLVIIGLSYTYWAFFTAALLVAALMIARLAAPLRPQVMRNAALFLLLVCVLAVINLMPGLKAQQELGSSSLNYKSATEAEIYALKLRTLLTPHENNLLRPLGQWGVKDRLAQFPMENENTSARLGPLAAVGVLVCIALIFSGPQFLKLDENRTLRVLSLLVLACFLLATAGGFGAIFNLLVTPDIRAYNRIVVFLAFFALAALAIVAQRLFVHAPGHPRPQYILALFLLFWAISLHDQVQTGLGLKASAVQAGLDQAEISAIVAAVEGHLAPGASIYQYPPRPFPVDAGVGEMSIYHHAKPYTVSDDLRWSWPSFHTRNAIWSQQFGNAERNAMASRLGQWGFDAVWVDRYGLVAEDRDIVEVLLAQGLRRIAESASGRYIVLALTLANPSDDGASPSARESDYSSKLRVSSPTVAILPVAGFHEQERDIIAGVDFRWSEKHGELLVYNPSRQATLVELKFRAVFSAGELEVRAGGESIILNPQDIATLRFPVEAGSFETVLFDGRMTRVWAPADPRSLFFQVRDLRVDIVDSVR